MRKPAEKRAAALTVHAQARGEKPVPARRHAHAGIAEPRVRVEILAEKRGAIAHGLEAGRDRVGLPLGGVGVHVHAAALAGRHADVVVEPA